MNETTHRFLRAIVDRVPEGRIAELRLFPAIRQGGVESAVAVVAVEQPELPLAPEAPDASSDDGAGDGFAALDGESLVVAEAIEVEVNDAAPSGEVASEGDAIEGGEGGESGLDASAGAASDVNAEVADVEVADVVVAELADRTSEEPVADAIDVEVTRIVATPFAVHSEGTLAFDGDEASDAPDAPDAEREADVEVVVEPDAIAPAVSAAAPVTHDDVAPSAGDEGGRAARTPTPADVEVVLAGDAPVAADAEGGEPAETIALGDILALPAREQPAEEVQKAADDASKRYAILTARYRLVLKGPDRGKWEVDIVHEADAPLATVERVARGVARRAGDESDPEHFSGDALLQVLERPSWATSA